MRSRAARTVLLAAALAAISAFVPGSAAAGLDGALKPARAAKAELETVRTVGIPGGTRIVRLEQRVGGVPVIDGEAVVVDAPGQPTDLVADGTRGAIDRPPTPRLSSAEAIEAAREASDIGRSNGHSRAELAIQPGEGGVLVWRVELGSDRPPAALEVLVDATSGEVVSSRDLLRRVSARAKIFDPNPVVTRGKFGGLRNKRDRDTELLTALRVPVTLQRLKSHQDCMLGKFVKVTTKLKAKAKSKPACRKHRHFSPITRSDPRFEALMAYHHIDRTQAYVQSLGVGSINDGRQRVFVNQFKDDNSFFDPFGGDIRFGRGGVDDAEDGDVIVHEYGHALQNAQVHNFGTTDPAGTIGEGFGDYMAAVMSSQSSGTTNEDDVCMFEWDGTSYAPPGACDRRADDPRTLTDAQGECKFEIHCVGQMWASALWDLRNVLGTDAQGRSVMDRVVLTSNFLLLRSAGFADGSQALLDADGTLYGGAHAAAIRAELEARGLLPTV